MICPILAAIAVDSRIIGNEFTGHTHRNQWVSRSAKC